MEDVISTKALNDAEQTQVAEMRASLRYLNEKQEYYKRAWKAKIFSDGKVSIREITTTKQVRHVKTCKNISQACQYVKDVEIAQSMGYKKVSGGLLTDQEKQIRASNNAKVKNQIKQTDELNSFHKTWKEKKKWSVK